jgi:hypothetical protein
MYVLDEQEMLVLVALQRVPASSGGGGGASIGGAVASGVVVWPPSPGVPLPVPELEPDVPLSWPKGMPVSDMKWTPVSPAPASPFETAVGVDKHAAIGRTAKAMGRHFFMTKDG